jgi:hypothetical protein
LFVVAHPTVITIPELNLRTIENKQNCTVTLLELLVKGDDYLNVCEFALRYYMRY